MDAVGVLIPRCGSRRNALVFATIVVVSFGAVRRARSVDGPLDRLTEDRSTEIVSERNHVFHRIMQNASAAGTKSPPESVRMRGVDLGHRVTAAREPVSKTPTRGVTQASPTASARHQAYSSRRNPDRENSFARRVPVRATAKQPPLPQFTPETACDAGSAALDQRPTLTARDDAGVHRLARAVPAEVSPPRAARSPLADTTGAATEPVKAKTGRLPAQTTIKEAPLPQYIPVTLYDLGSVDLERCASPSEPDNAHHSNASRQDAKQDTASAGPIPARRIPAQAAAQEPPLPQYKPVTIYDLGSVELDRRSTQDRIGEASSNAPDRKVPAEGQRSPVERRQQSESSRPDDDQFKSNAGRGAVQAASKDPPLPRFNPMMDGNPENQRQPGRIQYGQTARTAPAPKQRTTDRPIVKPTLSPVREPSTALGVNEPPRQYAPPRSLTPLQQIASLAETHNGYADGIAVRGATHAAHDEYVQALRIVAQARDVDDRSEDNSRALATGLIALDEADEFASSLTSATANSDVRRLIEAHRTPVLKAATEKRIPALSALQIYHNYAQNQLTRAVGRNPAASKTLCGMARLQIVQADAEVPERTVGTAKAIALFQAAVMVDSTNALASNELGVHLARCGRLGQAKKALLKSTSASQQPEPWLNLAKIYERLGQTQQAEFAHARFVALQAARHAAPATASHAADRQVRRVSPAAFAGTPISLPAAKQTSKK